MGYNIYKMFSVTIWMGMGERDLFCNKTVWMVLVIPIYYGNVPFTYYRGFTAVIILL